MRLCGTVAAASCLHEFVSRYGAAGVATDWHSACGHGRPDWLTARLERVPALVRRRRVLQRRLGLLRPGLSAPQATRAIVRLVPVDGSEPLR